MFRVRAKGSIVGTDKFDQEQISIIREIKLMNFAFGIGAGINLDEQIDGIILGISYERGFTDITNNFGSYQYSPSRGKVLDNSKTQTNNFTIRLSYLIK